MTVIIDGTNGITNVNGSAAAPAETGIDTDTGIYYGTNTVGLATNGTNALFVDASQNVGVGTTSPGVKLDVNGALRVGLASNPTTIANNSQFYDQSGIGPTISGYNFQVRTGNPTPTASLFVDSANNVGIGTTSPASKLDARTSGNGGISGPSTGTWTARVVHNNDASGGNGLSVQNRWAASSSILFECAMGWNGSAAGYYPVFTVDGLGQVIFAPQRTEAMRVDFNGNLLVGTTSSNPISSRVNGISLSPSNGFIFRLASQSSAFGLPTTSGTHIGFYTDNGSAAVSAGYISSNGGTTAYNATSDYRLKDNVRPLSGALARLAQLRPVRWTWKEGFGGTQPECEGFIAHELAEVCPQAVTGEKDAVNEDGSIKPQGVDTSFLVAILTAAIQELKTQNDDLRARVAALEGAK